MLSSFSVLLLVAAFQTLNNILFFHFQQTTPTYFVNKSDIFGSRISTASFRGWNKITFSLRAVSMLKNNVLLRLNV